MKFKNKTNSCSLWIEEAKTMVAWDKNGIADVTDKKAIKYLNEHGYTPVGQTISSAATPVINTKKS